MKYIWKMWKFTNIIIENFTGSILFSFMLLWKCFYITISSYVKQIVIRVYYNNSPYHQCIHLNLYVSVPSAEE